VSASKLILLCLIPVLACAQAPSPSTRPAPAGGLPPGERPAVSRPGLFFKEAWQQTAQGGEHPVTAQSNDDPDLDLNLYVPAGQILLTGVAGDENVPVHVWLGLCASPCDWIVSEISYADLRWLKLDIKRVVTVGNLVDKLDLSKVDAMGFADLMPGSGHGPGGWADVAQIEVYGRAVARDGAASR